MKRNERKKNNKTLDIHTNAEKEKPIEQWKGIKREETIMFIHSLDGLQFSTSCIVPSSLRVCVLPKAWSIRKIHVCSCTGDSMQQQQQRQQVDDDADDFVYIYKSALFDGIITNNITHTLCIN